MTARPKMGVADVLNKAADLLEPEGAWTQKAWYRNAAGREVKTGRTATCMCAEGAVFTVLGKKPTSVFVAARHPAFEALAAVVGDRWIADWNDAPGRTQAAVVSALRQAAKKAEQSA